MDKAKFDALVQEFTDWNTRATGPATRAEAIAEGMSLHSGKFSLGVPTYIERSKKSADAWDALSLVAQRLLRDPDPYRGPLPEDLAAWVADVVEDAPKKMKNKKKRPRPTKPGLTQWNYTRDENIWTWITLTTTPDFRATRNGTHGEEPCFEGGSACDVVGIALKLKYDAVEKIWINRWK